MKRFTLIALLLGASYSANAQIPVTDVANLTEQIVQYSQMLLEYERQFEQLTEARNQVEAITGNYGFGELLNSGVYRGARRYTPTTWRDTLRILDAGGLPGSVAEATYDDTQARMVNYETLMGQIESTENSKAIADLQARIAAENGTSLADLIRLQSVQLQQVSAVEAQQLVDETNMKRQTQYEDFAFGELPTE